MKFKLIKVYGTNDTVSKIKTSRGYEYREMTEKLPKRINKFLYKKTANYGIAANQVLHPMGNYNANIMKIFKLNKYF